MTYKDLMAKIVCDTTNLECMVHRCDNCPGFPTLEKFVKDKFAEVDIDEEVKYNQWANVDRSITTTLFKMKSKGITRTRTSVLCTQWLYTTKKTGN